MSQADTPQVQLWDMIKGIRVAMLTSVEADGSLHSRPMATLEADDSGEVWFFTRGESPKANNVERNPQIALTYAEPDKQLYVSLSGRAHLVHDQTRIDRFWNPALKAWFPNGKEDPGLALLRIEVERAEYWDAPANKMVQLAGFVKAIATHTEFNQGENKKIDMRKPLE